MDSNWASEHLLVIRTLMERSAIYRRALAPIMLLVGGIGIGAATVACFRPIDSNRAFALYWTCVSLLALAASYFLARRQALKEDEPFWSPPTRRVTQALMPAFFAGLTASLLFVSVGDRIPHATWLLALGWIVVYGCALHAAGFFMLRGFRLFGLAFVLLGAALLFASALTPPLQTSAAAHYVMGIFFGVFHLAYGIYLRFTERKNRA